MADRGLIGAPTKMVRFVAPPVNNDRSDTHVLEAAREVDGLSRPRSLEGACNLQMTVMWNTRKFLADLLLFSSIRGRDDQGCHPARTG